MIEIAKEDKRAIIKDLGKDGQGFQWYNRCFNCGYLIKEGEKLFKATRNRTSYRTSFFHSRYHKSDVNICMSCIIQMFLELDISDEQLNQYKKEYLCSKILPKL